MLLYTTTSEYSVLVYALLDTQSDSSFVFESVANKMKAKSEKTSLKLTAIDVIGGGNDEPYAVNRHLRWSIVGATTAYEIDKKETITVQVPDAERSLIYWHQILLKERLRKRLCHMTKSDSCR